MCIELSLKKYIRVQYGQRRGIVKQYENLCVNKILYRRNLFGIIINNVKTLFSTSRTYLWSNTPIESEGEIIGVFSLFTQMGTKT